MFKKLTSWIKRAPDRKVYIEVITALLTIPVMVTVLVTNLNNLSAAKKDKEVVTPSATPQEIVIKEVSDSKSQPHTTQVTPDTQTTTQPCKKDVGPVIISYPTENQTVTENPVHIIVNYSDDEYCAVVWSYRINEGQWSEYSNNSISLYDMPTGNKKLELRVQSTVSKDQQMITRQFVYSPSSTQQASPSAQ